MGFLLVVALVVAVLFGFVLLFGAPYVPTLRSQAELALDLLEVRPGQTLLELGVGDGKVAIAAARRGLHVVGIELNPLLAAIAWLRTRRYRRKVRIICGDYWRVAWPPETDIVYAFLLQKYMARLDGHIEKWRSGPVKLASIAFQLPAKQPVAAKQSVFVYEYRDTPKRTK